MTPDLRTQLAEDRTRVAEVLSRRGYGVISPDMPIVSALAPLLAAARAEGAAEALRDAADEVHVARFNAEDDPDARWPAGSPRKVDSFYAGCVFARGRLRAHAAHLSAHTTEGDPT